MKAELVPENGDPPIPITRDVTVIGRREFCDVRIDHPSLSKRHAVVVKTDGLLVIRDLATTNGTKVKGQRIRWAALLPDDRLTFGGYKVRVYLGPDDQPGPSERSARASAKAGRSVATANAPNSRGPAPVPSSPGSGFPAPSPVTGIPSYGTPVDDDLEIVMDIGNGSESDWRLIGSKPRADTGDDEELIIELD
jgi:pSer/pThr/pTyr-binding forkhead associated (FHA) protein